MRKKAGLSRPGAGYQGGENASLRQILPGHLRCINHARAMLRAGTNGVDLTFAN
jgi:hypothetical protein